MKKLKKRADPTALVAARLSGRLLTLDEVRALIKRCGYGGRRPSDSGASPEGWTMTLVWDKGWGWLAVRLKRGEPGGDDEGNSLWRISEVTDRR